VRVRNLTGDDFFFSLLVVRLENKVDWFNEGLTKSVEIVCSRSLQFSDLKIQSVLYRTFVEAMASFSKRSPHDSARCH
jgi:hypothetical protein